LDSRGGLAGASKAAEDRDDPQFVYLHDTLSYSTVAVKKLDQT